MSALSFHILSEHRDLLKDKLFNFDLSILESTCPSRLFRREQWYITKTRANLIGINRHDALRNSM